MVSSPTKRRQFAVWGAGPEQGLDVTGRSEQVALNISQPFVATKNWLLLANASGVHGGTQSDFSSVTVVGDHYQKPVAGFALTYTDTGVSINVSPAANFVAWHDEILGAQRDFETATGTASAQFSLKGNFSLSTVGSWQWTGAKLLPGDQVFTVGGPVTVRGYPINAVSGDSGYYTNVELHRDMSDVVKGLDLYVFLDDGAAFSTFPGEVDLTSTGFGGSWSPVPSLTFEANYGAPWRSVVPLEAHYQAYGRVIFRPLLLSHNS